MELYVVSYIILLGLTGFFTAYQFGLTWPYSSEAGNLERRLNIIAAIASGIAFFCMALFLLLVMTITLGWVDDWINIFRNEMNWIVGIVGGITLISGVGAFFWRMNEKQNQFHEFMEKATDHFKVEGNDSSNHHPYRADFAFMKWSRPEYASVQHSSKNNSSRMSLSIAGSPMRKSKPSSGSSKKAKKRSKNAGLGQLLILFIIVIIAALMAYTLVHLIAKWAIGIEEDWIREKRGWTNSDLLPANAIT